MKNIIVLLYLGLNSCVFAQRYDSEWGKISEKDWALNEVDFEPGADAVVLHEEAKLELTNYGYLIKFYRKIKILKNKESDFDLINYTYNPKNKYNNFKVLDLMVYNKNGNEVIKTPFNKSDIIEIAEKENRTRLKYLIPNLKNGSIIEMKMEYMSSSDIYSTPWYFQNDFPTLFSRVFVDTYANYDYQIILIGEKLNLKYGKRKGLKSWELKNIPSIESFDKIYSLRDFRETLNVQYTAQQNWHGTIVSSKDWKSIRKVLLKDIDDKTSRVDFRKLAMEIPNGKTELETYQNVLQYIHQNFKWNNSNSGTIQNLNSVLSNKSGNHFELNVLFHELLRAKNVNSILIINSSRSSGKIPLNFPMLSRLNSFVNLSLIDNQYYIADVEAVRSRDYKFPNLSYYNEIVLRLDSQNDQFIQVQPPLSENTSFQELIFRDNRIDLRVLDQFNGYYTKENQMPIVFNVVDELYTTSEDIQNVSVSSINRVFVKNDKDFSFGSFEMPFHQVLNYLKIDDDRNYQVEIDFPKQEVVKFRMKVPENYEVQLTNFNQKISAFGQSFQYEQKVELKDNELEVLYILYINKTIIKGNELNEYRDFLSQVENISKNTILIKRL